MLLFGHTAAAMHPNVSPCQSDASRERSARKKPLFSQDQGWVTMHQVSNFENGAFASRPSA